MWKESSSDPLPVPIARRRALWVGSGGGEVTREYAPGDEGFQTADRQKIEGSQADDDVAATAGSYPSRLPNCEIGDRNLFPKSVIDIA